MTETMLAERFHAADRSITLEDIPIPHPGPGEVLVKVAYCGICHSDLSLISGAFPAALPVVTQGHEASGTCLLYTSPSPRDVEESRMPSSA